ncbi:MAG: hypothetical protein ACI4J7_11255 [Ruminiclostridium sp.]
MDQQTAIIIVIGAVLVFGIIPFALNRRFVGKYRETAFLIFPMLLQIAGAVASVYFSVDSESPAFIISVILTIIIYIISMCASFVKAATLGASTGDCITAAIVQLLIPIGIVIIILSFLSGETGKKKKKSK